ncbi:outer membrane beta-barrel protein [Enterovibrio coralii]|uniref:OmpA-like domain-containing protein n=1 Tax=Enterovibrio coralii TaxID=294935 RepID=A0A135I5F9_9GAMM|nr:outer membrane beta-barrel protein [Enterovibrio coralii]KXF80679.1 hypothetical protein ATN88_08570 [Enterovibrio coralii]
MKKLNSLYLLISLNMLSVYSVASAETDFPFDPFVEVVGGYSKALDSGADLSENAGVYGLGLGMEIYKNVDLKAQYQDYSKIDVDSKNLSVKTKIYNYELSYRYPIGHEVSVVAGVGAGYWKMTKYQGSTTIMANGVAPMARVGLDYDINKNISASLSYQYVNAIGDLFTGEYDAHNMLLGVKYSFGGREEMTPTPVLEQVVVEDFVVEEQPVPAIGAVVPMTFCNKIVTPIMFNFDESVLSANNKAELRAVIQYMKANNLNGVTLVGYTDDKGSENYNSSLAKRRVDAVEKFFENEGLTVHRNIANGKDRTNFKSDYAKRRVDVYVDALLNKEIACDQKFGF